MVETGRGFTVQIVQSGRDVAHQGHEEEWDLEHMVCHEVQASHKFLIPSYSIEVDDERYEPQAHSDSDNLEAARVSTRMGVGGCLATPIEDEPGHR